jgi:hypothetical protein
MRDKDSLIPNIRQAHLSHFIFKKLRITKICKKNNLEYYNLDKPIDSYKYGVSTQWINEYDFEKFKQEYPLIPILC